MRRDDWFLAQLPMGMLEDDFFTRFASIFQEVATSLVDVVDNFDNVADVTVAPEPVVRWLGSWIDAPAIDPDLPHALQRRIVREAGQILAWRGTARGLRQFLELVCEAPVTVEESGGVFAEGEAPSGAPWVSVRVPSTGWVPRDDFVRLVLDEVPVNVQLAIFVGDERVWPVVEEPVEEVRA